MTGYAGRISAPKPLPADKGPYQMGLRRAAELPPMPPGDSKEGRGLDPAGFGRRAQRPEGRHGAPLLEITRPALDT
jgi:hypothetical protein